MRRVKVKITDQSEVLFKQKRPRCIKVGNGPLICRKVIFNRSFFFSVRIEKLSQSSTQLTFCSVATISCWAIEFAAIPVLDKVLKTQELVPGPGGPWVPLNPDGPRRP